MRRLLARLRGPWVGDDPHPEHGLNAPAADTYPTEAQVHATLVRATTTPGGTVLLMPWQYERATRELMALIDQGHTHGEVGDISTIRAAVRPGATLRKWVA